MKSIIEYSVSIEFEDDGRHCPYHIFSVSFSVDEDPLSDEKVRELISERFEKDVYDKSEYLVSDLKLDKSFKRISVFGVNVKTYVKAGFTIYPDNKE